MMIGSSFPLGTQNSTKVSSILIPVYAGQKERTSNKQSVESNNIYSNILVTPALSADERVSRFGKDSLSCPERKHSIPS